MTNPTTNSMSSQSFEAGVRQGYYDLRNALIAEMSDLAIRAGEAALKAMHDANDTVARADALRMKGEHSGLNIVRDRLDGEWRHQESPLQFVQAARRSLASNVDWYRQEAGQYALKIIDMDPQSENYAKDHYQAMRAHQYTLVHERCLAKFDALFGPLTASAAGA